VHGARAQDIKLSSRKILTTATREASLTSHGTLAQITLGTAYARLEQEPLSLPDSALAQAACDGGELTMLSGMTTAAAAAIVSFASSSSLILVKPRK